MARKANGAGKIRAEWEAVTLTLVDVEEVLPFIRQRIEQAVRRSGLNDLLNPALEDLDRVVVDVAQAKSQVQVAARLMKDRS